LASYSLRAYRRVQLEEAVRDSATGRQRFVLLERHLTGLRLTCSFCRGLANVMLVLSMLCLFDVSERGVPGAVGAILVTVAIYAVLGVAIPHAWAAYQGQKIALALVRPLLVCRYVMYPITAVMEALEVPVRRLCGATDEAARNSNAKQEILQVATEGQAEGSVDADEVEMIESVIEFGETRAEQIMTPRTDLFALPAETPWAEACQKITEAGHSRVPIYEVDVDNIVGILYAKDLLKYSEQNQPRSLREVMRKPFYIPESKLLDELLREFKARKVHLAVVLDEYGGTAGVVTIEDVIEEIAGEIADEYDVPEPVLMNRLDENTAEVDGRMYVDDLNDAMNLELPENEGYDTVAGMVFAELGYIPSEGEQLTAYGAQFTILAADERKITKLKVEKIQQEQPTQ